MAKLKTDWILFTTIVAMVGLGIVVLYSASGGAELRWNYEPYHFLWRQILWALGSFAALMFFRRLDYRTLNSPTWAFSGLGIVLTLLVAVYFIDPAQHRWFKVWKFGGLQPSEFAKPALIVFLAYFLERRAQIINDRKTLQQATLAIFVLAVLVVLSDLGTAMVPVITALILFWIAGLESRYMLRVLAACCVLGALAIASKGYRLGRVIAFVDPTYATIEKIDTGKVIRHYVESSKKKQSSQDATMMASVAVVATAKKDDANYQPIQSVRAVGAGGLFGEGISDGRENLMFLPDAHTDFIYAAVGESFGLVGTLGVLGAFLIILWRGGRLFLLARGDFGKYLALGITVSIVVQALVNISVALAMAPTKGFPLPMISFGGSSMLSTLMSLGMLLSVAEHEG